MIYQFLWGFGLRIASVVPLKFDWKFRCKFILKFLRQFLWNFFGNSFCEILQQFYWDPFCNSLEFHCSYIFPGNCFSSFWSFFGFALAIFFFLRKFLWEYIWQSHCEWVRCSALYIGITSPGKLCEKFFDNSLEIFSEVL